MSNNSEIIDYLEKICRELEEKKFHGPARYFRDTINRMELLSKSTEERAELYEELSKTGRLTDFTPGISEETYETWNKLVIASQEALEKEILKGK